MSQENEQRPPYPTGMQGQQPQDNSWYAAAQARANAREASSAAQGAGAQTSVPPTSVPPTPGQPVGSAWQGKTAAAPRPAGYGAPIPGTTAPAAGAGQVPPVQPPASAPQGHGKHPKRPGGHRGLKTFALSLLGGIVGAAALVGVLKVTGVIDSTTTITANGPTQSITIDPSDDDATIANAVAAKALPSVVSINVSSSEGEGVGSGVVLDTDGNILTNYHVVEGAQSISVSANGNSFDGTVVGTDQTSDLAVVKIDPGSNTLTPIEVGDSSKLQIGDWVMSIGSPFGLEQSVSTGIVSSLYRSTMMQGTSGNTIYTNLIQTDAAINPGNSGGALVDAQGKLVGINSIIESASGSSSGVGFAIPGNYAVDIAQKIIKGEPVTHAYLGGSFQTVTAQNARRNNLKVTQGAYVAEVTSGGPADQAGIKVGDIITAIDDQEITSSDGVVLAVRSHSVGDTVQVKLNRDGQEMIVSVTLGSDESLQSQQSQDQSSQESLLDEYLRQYGYGDGSGSGSDSGGYGGLGGSGLGGGSGSGLGGLSSYSGSDGASVSQS